MIEITLPIVLALALVVCAMVVAFISRKRGL